MTSKDFSDMFDEDGVVITGEKDEPSPQPQHDAPPPAATPIQTNLITNTQAGAEFNVFFKNNGGFKCHLKLHAPSGREVLEHAAGALAYLAANNFVPEHSTATTPTEPTREDLPQDGTASASFCTIHNVEMKRREKDGQVWYSHKIAGTENDWCRGAK